MGANMNIFYLHSDPKTCASMHCDKHVVKMILETAQMLSTAHHELDGEEAIEGIYRTTHNNQPSNVWVRENYGNYYYAWSLLYYLLKEYGKRYGKIHATHRLLEPLKTRPKNLDITPTPTEPPQCMPDEFKCDDYVEAYRAYYRKDKRYILQWTGRPVPEWIGA